MKARVKSIQSVFAEFNLHIPNYQRPYRWQTSHVQTLLDDLSREFSERRAAAYRLGSLVLHRVGDSHHVVDGQQRLTTLALLWHVLDSGANIDFLRQKFRHSESRRNIVSNHTYICRFFENFSESKRQDFLESMKNQCEMVCIVLHGLDEAFRFFETQSTRGRPLSPHDLLKAHHLRVIPEESARIKCVKRWEEADALPSDAPNLKVMISHVLFTIRSWRKHEKTAYTFTHADLPEFKGVHPKSPFTYVRQQVKAHACYKNDESGQSVPPFSLGSPIIDGEVFFDHVAYYHDLYQRLFALEGGRLSHIKLQNGNTLLHFVKNGGGWHLKNLFECTVLAYVDRFGEARLEDAVHHIFRWVYTTRLKNSRIRTENVATNKSELFAFIQDARTPDEVLRFHVPKVKRSEIEYKKMEKLSELVED